MCLYMHIYTPIYFFFTHKNSVCWHLFTSAFRFVDRTAHNVRKESECSRVILNIEKNFLIPKRTNKNLVVLYSSKNLYLKQISNAYEDKMFNGCDEHLHKMMNTYIKVGMSNWRNRLDFAKSNFIDHERLYSDYIHFPLFWPRLNRPDRETPTPPPS